MTDDELIARLKKSAPQPKEAGSEQFWADFQAGVGRGIDGAPERRRPRWLLGVAAAGLAVAAAFAVAHFGARPSNPMPGAHPRVVSDELDGQDDPTDPAQMIGDLDLDELKAVDATFKQGA